MNSEKEILPKNAVFEKKELENSHSFDEQEEHSDEDTSLADFSGLSREELLNELESFSIESNWNRSIGFLREIKASFDHLEETEKQEALEKFVREGGEKEDFELKKDEGSVKFEKLYNRLREELTNRSHQQEQEKEKNLKVKENILEQLRELTSGEESSTSLDAFKELQNEWKNTGPLPPGKSKELWANYNALVDMFYNNRTIYFELKELDRKKNLEAKKEIIEKAEKLLENTKLHEVFRELKKLHEEYKNIGPVPKEEQEELWNRFKEASDKLYQKRGELLLQNKQFQEENLIKKADLIEKAKKFGGFQTDKINEWKDKTLEIINLQKEWKGIGAIPPDKTREISKAFWSAYKGFFKNKDRFFKELEQEKLENLKKKIALCEQAETLKDSEDISDTAENLKKLQSEWNKIGPVPLKQKEETFKRFKAACDYFFNRKREQVAETEKEYEENLKKKISIIDQINALTDEQEVKDQQAIRTLQQEFSKIGFVPKKDIKPVKEKYKEAVEKYLNHMTASGKAGNKIKLELEVSALKSEPGARKKLHKKESDIIRKIQQLKSDIQTFNTNIEFLSNSPKADKLREQVQKNIEESQKQVQDLQEQLKIIREM